MLIDKNKYIEHINDEDQILTMRKVLDKVEKVLKYHVDQCTDFLDPYQIKLSYSILNRFIDINYHQEGGYEDSERKVIIIYPSYKVKDDVDSCISALKVEGNFKFTDLNHRDYLGAIMGLGIKREKVGDILIHDSHGKIVLNKEILEYIKYNLESIGKETVEVKEIGLEEVSKGIEEYKEISATVSSLRLDAVLSSAYNLSRSSSAKYIKSSKVKVNWKPIDQISFEINEGDLLSVKGYGRMRLHKINGTSKKGRIKIVIRILK